MAGRRRGLPAGVIGGCIAALLVFAAGLGFSLTRADVWSASTSLLVAPDVTDADADTLAGLYDTLSRGQVVATYAELLREPDVEKAAEDRAGIAAPDRAGVDVAVTVVADTSLIDVTASGPDAQVATRLADAVAAEGESRIGALASPYGVRVAGGAAGSTAPDGPGTPMLVAVSAILAVLAGVVAQQVVSALAGRRQRPAAAVRDWPDVTVREPTPTR